MKSQQKGEVLILVMVVMMAVVWLGGKHMGMMHIGEYAKNPSDTAQQTKNELPKLTVAQETSEHQH